MWICPKCKRNFASDNQSHMCSDNTLDDILEKASENMILAFDKLLISVIDWDPCTVGASTKSIVFTKKKAWLIIKPMAKELDVKFYYPEKIQSPFVFKTTFFGNKHAHHIRISEEHQITNEVLALIRKGWEAYD